MPGPIDHILFGLLVLLFPVWGTTFGVRRLKRAAAPELSRVRLSVYRGAMALQWTLTAVILSLWILRPADRYWGPPTAGGIGLAPVLSMGLIGIVLGLAIVAFVLVRERRRAMADDESLARVRDQIRGRGLEPMLPHSKTELHVFYGLSLTAGLCEELMYRGYLIWYLSHWLGVIQSAGLAAIFFGLGHAYQGWRGMLLTAAVGAFLSAVYLLSGSLYAPMLIHALMDLHSGHISYVALEREVVKSAGEPPEIDPFCPPGAGDDVMPPPRPNPLATDPPDAMHGPIV